MRESRRVRLVRIARSLSPVSRLLLMQPLRGRVWCKECRVRIAAARRDHCPVCATAAQPARNAA